MMTDNGSTFVLDLVDTTERTTARTTGLVTPLFGLSLATALPPAAMFAPPGGGRPVVKSDPHTILNPMDLAVVLDRPTAEVWRGRVALGEIDERLGGLEILLYVFQVTDGSGALVCLSAVRPDPAAPGDGGATPADLWKLACEALVRYDIAYEWHVGIGDDAFLVVYGGVTAQVAWVTVDRLATVSVTCLAGEQGWAVEAVRSIAILANDYLAIEHRLRQSSAS
jgi:hypothetical protein